MTPPANAGPGRFLPPVEGGIDRRRRASDDVIVDPLAHIQRTCERTQEHGPRIPSDARRRGSSTERDGRQGRGQTVCQRWWHRAPRSSVRQRSSATRTGIACQLRVYSSPSIGPGPPGGTEDHPTRARPSADQDISETTHARTSHRRPRQIAHRTRDEGLAGEHPSRRPCGDRRHSRCSIGFRSSTAPRSRTSSADAGCPAVSRGSTSGASSASCAGSTSPARPSPGTARPRCRPRAWPRTPSAPARAMSS